MLCPSLGNLLGIEAAVLDYLDYGLTLTESNWFSASKCVRVLVLSEIEVEMLTGMGTLG